MFRVVRPINILLTLPIYSKQYRKNIRIINYMKLVAKHACIQARVCTYLDTHICKVHTYIHT